MQRTQWQEDPIARDFDAGAILCVVWMLLGDAVQVTDMCSAPEPGPLRPPDWAESAATVAALRRGKHYALLIATEHMARLSVGWRPPTARQARGDRLSDTCAGFMLLLRSLPRIICTAHCVFKRCREWTAVMRSGSGVGGCSGGGHRSSVRSGQPLRRAPGARRCS